MICAAAIAMLGAAVLAPEPARATKLRTIETPSRHVDPADVAFNGSDHPGRLRAKILLPDGYDGKRRMPVLYLLHGVGDSFRQFARPDRGNIRHIARDLEAIVVMPEAARGFYANWWNDGLRRRPAWERFYLEELIPLIERRFRVRRGRRWHAVAGLSMGGLGATFLAGQLPGYFGSAATFSGFVQHQRPEVALAFEYVAETSYEAIFGPIDGFYAAGHNPTALAANLRHTRLYVTVGDGVPQPGVQASPTSVGLAGLVEAELRQQAGEFVTAARAAGVRVHYRRLGGVHDWPYWRRHLREVIGWGLFEPVAKRPRRWSYETVGRRGRAWTLRYRFDSPPDGIVRFARERGRLLGYGAGVATLRHRGCQIRVRLPFERPWPGRLCK